MNVSITVETLFPALPESVFRLFTDESSFSSFEGAWPIPGIARVEHLGGDGTQPGNVLRMINTDGSAHEETVITYEINRRIVFRLGSFQAPLRFMIKEGLDSAEFLPDPSGKGTLLRQTFRFKPTSLFTWPIVWLIGNFRFRRALRILHSNLRRKHARQNGLGDRMS